MINQSKTSGFLAIPLIIVGVLLLLAVGGGLYYLGQRQVVQQRAAEPTNAPTVPPPTPTVILPSPTPQATPTQVPLPTVSPREIISRVFSDRSFDALRPLMTDNIHHTIWATECCQDSGIDAALTFISGKVNASTATWTFDQSDPTISRVRSSDRSFESYYIGLASDGQVFMFIFNAENQINGVMYTRDYRLITR